VVARAMANTRSPARRAGALKGLLTYLTGSGR
jgi:hypothetical protein